MNILKIHKFSIWNNIKWKKFSYFLMTLWALRLFCAGVWCCSQNLLKSLFCTKWSKSCFAVGLSIASLPSPLLFFNVSLMHLLVNKLLWKACHVPGTGLGISNTKMYGHSCIPKKIIVWSKGSGNWSETPYRGRCMCGRWMLGRALNPD